jgi:hypothetical protein
VRAVLTTPLKTVLVANLRGLCRNIGRRDIYFCYSGTVEIFGNDYNKSKNLIQEETYKTPFRAKHLVFSSAV